MLSPQEIDTSYRLLSSVFPEGSKARQDYDSVISERDTKGFSLFNPLPDVLGEEVYLYAGRFYGGDRDKHLLKDALQGANRAEAADILISAVSVYENYPQDEVAIESIGYGTALIKEITGFDTDVVSESQLKDLLPKAAFPRRVNYLYLLLEMRKQLLEAQVNNYRTIQYKTTNGYDDIIAAEVRLFKFGLQLAAKKRVVTSVINSYSDLQHTSYTFEVSDAVTAFEALTNYNLNNELQNIGR